MTVQELIDELIKVTDKSEPVFIRVGGLPFLDVGSVTIDTDGSVILSDYE